MLSWLNNKIPAWSSLHALSTNRVVRSSYFWFVFVPLVAKLLEKVPTTIRLPWSEQVVTFQLALPFSWQLFFFAATAFSIGAVVFSVRAPEIVRRYRAFSDFQAEGRSTTQLIELYSRLCLKRVQNKKHAHSVRQGLREFHQAYCTKNAAVNVESLIEGGSLPQAMSELKIVPDHLNGAFWHVRSFADRLRPISRCACTVAYALGMGLILIVLVQNVASVVRMNGGIMSATSAPMQTAPTSQWLRFKGTVIQRSSSEAVIAAGDGSGAILAVPLPDVRAASPDYLELKLGVRARVLQAPKTERVSKTGGQVCRGQGTMCTGEGEFCCEYGRAP